MRGRASRLFAIVAVIAGLVVSTNSELSFNAWLIEQIEYDRCAWKEAPEGTVEWTDFGMSEESVTEFPLGLSCSWELASGEIVTERFPLWAWSAYEAAG